MTDEERETRDIEEWFRERGRRLTYGFMGRFTRPGVTREPVEVEEWVAVIYSDREDSRSEDGGGGFSRLEAARDAKRRFEQREASS